MSVPCLLILGKCPPPTGGVTIHVFRLVEHLKRADVKFYHSGLTPKEIGTSCFFILFRKYKLIHLHSSSPLLRFVMSFWCWLTRNRLAITYHGSLGRYGKMKNCFDYASLFFCRYPILLNEDSHKKALLINNKSNLISAFFPPLDADPLDQSLIDELTLLKKNFQVVFCTNAYDVTFDKYGNEIYSITDLVRIFNRLREASLVISDQSGNYIKYLRDSGCRISRNIKFITNHHSFVEIIKLTDCMIRATTTDGDSISVKESLYFATPVIASDCISRPPGVILYNSGDMNDLFEKIIKLIFQVKEGHNILPKTLKLDNTFHELNKKIYTSLGL